MNDGCAHLRTLGRLDLTGPDGTQARSVLAQPKRFALLLYLAAATPRGFQRKDTLLALFWPESPDGRARRALNRAVYYLRQSLDRTVLVGRGDEEVAVAEERVWCDVVEFERAADAGRLEQALELYQGDFAPGFYVDGLAELERWVESERARLRDRAVGAAIGLAEREEARGELALAAHWAHRATTLAPHDERAAQRRIRLLDRAGDRAGAVGAYEALAARLRDDLGVEPSPETQALDAAVRGRREPAVQARMPVRPIADLYPDAGSATAAAPVARREERHRFAWATGGALVAGGIAALALLPHRPSALTIGRRTAVAVGPEFERWPALSRDGETLFYTLSGPGGDELFAQQLKGGRPVPLTAHIPGSQRYGTLSPDGTQLLFRQDDGLYVMPALGGGTRRVVADKIHTYHPGLQALPGGWAPDGSRIVYAEQDTLFIQAVRGADRVAVATGAAIHSPAWSPDGRWIAYVQGNPDFHMRGNLAASAIHVVLADGGEPVAVTDAAALHTSPIWVPGRRSLLFVSDREGGRDIYEVSLARDGSPHAPPVRITTGLNPERLAISADGRRLAWSVLTETSNIRSLDIGIDSGPLSQARQVTAGTQLVEAVGNVSPDGAWLYYHSDRSGASDLWRLPLAGGAPERLATDSAENFAPTVSPDGQEVAFHSLRTGKREIFVMPAAGGPAVQVSTGPGEGGVPAWSPDGRALIWLSDDTILIARRNADGSWKSPLPLLTRCRCGGWAQWSPDGRWISHPGLAGLELFNPVTRQRRPLGGEAGVTWHAWSADGRTVFGVNPGWRDGVRIVAIQVASGRERLLAYADNPPFQLQRYGLAVHGARLYFPLVERKADVWVADIGGN